jgi:hypothetical protein
MAETDTFDIVDPNASVAPAPALQGGNAEKKNSCKNHPAFPVFISVKTIRLKIVMSLGIQVVRQMRRAAAVGFGTQAKLQLATSPAGRIVLHLACAWRDHRYQWHWQGVAREMARARA